MIKYDDFSKLPIFKKGWICFGRDFAYFYKKKPKWSKNYYCWYGNGLEYKIDTGFLCVDLKGVKPEESLRKVGVESKISRFISTDLSIGDKVYALTYTLQHDEKCWYVYDKALQITNISLHYYPRQSVESVELDLFYEGRERASCLVYDRKDVYKTKKEAQKECDRRNAELKRKDKK